MNQKNKSRNTAKAGTKTANKQQKQRSPPPKKVGRSQRPGQQVSVASAYATGQAGKAPLVTASAKGCRIIHRELIASVTGTVNFTVANSFALNPGIAATFPWLSTMAQSWEQYRFHKLRFCYYTRTGTNVPGSVLMVPDYDAADAAPSTEQIASSFEGTQEDAPWKDIQCNLPASRMHASQPRHYVRTAALAANLDIKTYDVGNLFLCTIDGTAVSWGKLWVEYDVEFSLPQLPSSGAIAIYGGSIIGANTMTAANPFGIAPVVDAQAVGLAISAASVVSFTQLGSFIITWRVVGTVISAFTAPVNGAGVAFTPSIQSSFNAAATSGIAYFGVVVSALGTATLDFSNSVTATTVTSSSLYVGDVPPSSLT